MMMVGDVLDWKEVYRQRFGSEPSESLARTVERAIQHGISTFAVGVSVIAARQQTTDLEDAADIIVDELREARAEERRVGKEG